MRLVLIRLSAMGDILRTLPAWKNLLDAFPLATFQVVIEDRHAFLLEPFTKLEPIIVRRGNLSNPAAAMRELSEVGKVVRGADASLDFHGIIKSAIIPYLGRVKARWGDGATKEGAAWLQNHRLPYKRQDRYSQALRLSETFGANHGVSNLGQFWPILKDAVLPPCSAWHSLERSSKPKILLIPGTSRVGANKRWPLRHWIRLAEELSSSAETRWVLGPDEEALRSWLPEKSGIRSLPKLPFWELASAIREANRVIVGDTGLLHLSVLLGVKTTALMGPSDPIISGIPPGTGDIVRAGAECSPCREKRCLRLSCMEQLKVRQVLETL